ncbi:hypothetical protein GOQ27_13510 [Clostridium sp. D2Q-11]|uniref:Flavodoxin-like domain-containing protein n=1 Tax=Anaeromonas frigoriresistens TaxID=2683708 RepID=A0A942V1K2_9FIRM|nr:flavodoxin domain-containing protein [Anaeromonas frigoriresistens]MBS4539487.1 hypothetical protein [Anaeromonas frigoriresistens]
MESILIIYKTKTGFTKKYVDWITEVITCQTIPFDQVNNVDLNRYDIIIYGAGMHAGHIQGVKEFKKKVLDLSSKKIVVFATGGAPYSKEIFSTIEMNNFSVNELNSIKFYYFQSGINYEKMGLLDKTIMRTYNRVLEFKNNKSDIEEGTRKAISKSYDHSSSEYIKPMIDYLNQLLNRPSSKEN